MPVPRLIPTPATCAGSPIPPSLLGLNERPTRQISKTPGSTVWGDLETVEISKSQ